MAERLIDEPASVAEERELTRGYYTTYNEELEETIFIPGGKVDEPVADENGEPLSFQATIETMKTIDGGSGGHSVAIIEGIEVKEAIFENGIATVHYTVHEEDVSEADQIVFERAMQLTALDFHADELHLFNETKKIKSVYPLLIER